MYNKEWAKEYYLKNKERILAYAHRYNSKHQKQIREYYKKNKNKILLYNQSYKITHRKELFLKHQERLKTNVQYKLKWNLRSRLRDAIRYNLKSGSAVRDLGCSVEFLKLYLQDKFYAKMSWNNYGTYWEIDHIIPLKDFDLTKRKQFLKAVHYTNLQPLTVKDHDRKSAKA